MLPITAALSYRNLHEFIHASVIIMPINAAIKHLLFQRLSRDEPLSVLPMDGPSLQGEDYR
jgi:hypothetical protein